MKDLLDWKLLEGSHEWPGPDGGTCINEAAVVVAGFEYRKIVNERDFPPCFSPVLGLYMLQLNDSMPDDERQKLIEFAPRLSGSCDKPDVELVRLNHIALETVRRVLPIALRAAGLSQEALACEQVTTLHKAVRAATTAAVAAVVRVATARAATTAAVATARVAAATAAAATAAAEAVDAATRVAATAAATRAATRVATAATRAATRVATAATRAATTAATTAVDAATVWDIAIQILREAIAIGNQAPEIEVNMIRQRLEAIS